MTDTLENPAATAAAEGTTTATSAGAETEMRAYSDVEYVFKPHDNSMPAARQYLRDVWDRWPFMRANAKAEMKGPYSGTVLGEGWQIVDPLFQALIYWFLFTAIRGRGSSGYFLMVVAGVFLFNVSMTAIGQGGRSIQSSKGLVLNSTFPLATLPLSIVYRSLLEFVPTIGVYAIFHLLFGGARSASLFLLPMLFVLQLAISIGMMFFFSIITVYVRDMSKLLDYIIRILMFVTPVIYPASQLEKLPSLLGIVLHLNPLFAIFSTYQTVLGGSMPRGSLMVETLFWAVVLPIAGFRFFVSRERGLALRL